MIIDPKFVKLTADVPKIYFRNVGSPERLHCWESFWGKKLPEVSIGKDFGALRGI